MRKEEGKIGAIVTQAGALAKKVDFPEEGSRGKEFDLRDHRETLSIGYVCTGKKGSQLERGTGDREDRRWGVETRAKGSYYMNSSSLSQSTAVWTRFSQKPGGRRGQEKEAVCDQALPGLEFGKGVRQGEAGEYRGGGELDGPSGRSAIDLDLGWKGTLQRVR